MKKILAILMLLPSLLLADLTGTEGLAIDLSSAGAGLDFTIAFDPTELLGNRTWGDGSTDTIVWTWNRATGTDPTITFSSGSIGLQALTLISGLDIGTSQSITGTTAMTLGDGTQTSTVNTTSHTFNLDTQNYTWDGRSGILTLEGQSTGTAAGLEMFPLDGDGTDEVTFSIYAVGTPADVTNRERMKLRWNQATSEFELCSEASGTGTNRAINMVAAGGSTGQLKLETDNTVSMSSLTASEIVITDASKKLVSAAVATYPSLTELAYVKGVTSAIQAQIDTKGAHAGQVWTGAHDFGGADLELPQATPAVPDADGEIELDFTDGTMVVQHGAAHAELGGATDLVMGKMIKSFGGTIFEPDGINDVMTVKAVNSIEFPHGIVITAIYLGIASNTTYTLTVQNFDDFDTINAGNPTIDAVTYTADTTGEIIDTSPTYATIAAGQLIMISIPATDVDWIHFEIYYYEPAA